MKSSSLYIVKFWYWRTASAKKQKAQFGWKFVGQNCTNFTLSLSMDEHMYVPGCRADQQWKNRALQPYREAKGRCFLVQKGDENGLICRLCWRGIWGLLQRPAKSRYILYELVVCKIVLPYNRIVPNTVEWNNDTDKQ